MLANPYIYNVLPLISSTRSAGLRAPPFLPRLNSLNVPFFATKPMRRSVLMRFWPIACLRLLTMRPFFVFIRSFLVRPPGVFFAVPCQTWALEPTVSISIFIVKNFNLVYLVRKPRPIPHIKTRYFTSLHILYKVSHLFGVIHTSKMNQEIPLLPKTLSRHSH